MPVSTSHIGKLTLKFMSESVLILAHVHTYIGVSFHIGVKDLLVLDNTRCS